MLDTAKQKIEQRLNSLVELYNVKKNEVTLQTALLKEKETEAAELWGRIFELRQLQNFLNQPAQQSESQRQE